MDIIHMPRMDSLHNLVEIQFWRHLFEIKSLVLHNEEVREFYTTFILLSIEALAPGYATTVKSWTRTCLEKFWEYPGVESGWLLEKFVV